MAKRANRSNQVQDERVEESATPEFAAANFASADRAEVRDGVLDSREVGQYEPQLTQEGKVTVAAAEASNAARLARGEEPVVENVEEANEEANKTDLLPEDTGAEDTMAVRQSNVDRVVDGEIQRAEEPVSDINTANAEPSAKE